MALRNAFAQVAAEPTLAEARDHLAAIRTGQQGLREAANGGTVWESTTGRVALSVAGNIRLTFHNPPTAAGATPVNVDVLRLRGFGTAVGYATLILNPTTGLPATAVRPALNMRTAPAPPIPATAELRVDTHTTTALGGGTDTGVVLAVPPNRQTELELPPFRLTPGNMLGVSIPFTGAADAVIGLTWVVKPA